MTSKATPPTHPGSTIPGPTIPGATILGSPFRASPARASPAALTEERARAAEAFALAYARKKGGRVRVRPDVWLELRAAGADMTLYICDTR